MTKRKRFGIITKLSGGDVGADDSACRQNAHQHGEVEGGAGLFDVGGGKIDDDGAVREFEAAGHDGVIDTLVGFLNGIVGQADDLVFGKFIVKFGFYGNRDAVHAEEGGRIGFCQHSLASLVLSFLYDSISEKICQIKNKSKNIQKY